MAIAGDHQPALRRKDRRGIETPSGRAIVDRPSGKNCLRASEVGQLDPFDIAGKRIRGDFGNHGTPGPHAGCQPQNRKKEVPDDHRRHYPAFRAAIRLLAGIALAANAALADSTPPDSLVDATTVLSDDSLSWYDSLERDRPLPTSLRWAATTRDGTSRHSVSFLRDVDSGLSLAWRHSTPGGLANRNLSWKSNAVSVRIGDLAPWTRLPLLEGAASRSGATATDTSLSRRLLFGAGRAANGIDLEAGGDSWRIRSRGRIERDPCGQTGGSGAIAASYRFVTIGARISSTDSAAMAPVAAAIAIGSSRNRIEATFVESADHGIVAAWLASAAMDREQTRLRLALRHVPNGFKHDGTTSRWTGTTAGTISLRRAVRDESAVRFQLDARRDSLGKVDSKAQTEFSVEEDDWSLRTIGSWSENSASTPRWSARSRATRSMGPATPSLEISLSDSAGMQNVSTRIGAEVRRGSQILSGSVSYSALTGTSWGVSHSSEAETASMRLSFLLAAKSSLRDDAPIVATGSIACSW